jgi:hypothetical protein
MMHFFCAILTPAYSTAAKHFSDIEVRGQDPMFRTAAILLTVSTVT